MEKRERAARLFALGVSRAEVARRLGVARSTATHWYRAWRSGDLLAPRRRGRPSRLDGAARARIDAALLASPRRAGFDLDQWSLASVAALVERLAGERFHRRHIGRLLRRSGWVVPPVGRSADAALLRRTMSDREGNPVQLFFRRR